MGHVLFVWELGAGLGHLTRCRTLADDLRAKGHRVSFVLRDLFQAKAVLGEQETALFQAPIRQNTPKPSVISLNYSDILHGAGYQDEAGLSSLVTAWRALFELLQPDLVLYDHAPTALLASKGQRFQQAIIGSGFFTPPESENTPLFVGGSDEHQQHARASDRRVLQVINAVLANLQQPPLKRLSDLFAVQEHFLCTVAALDPYPTRTSARYWGLVHQQASQGLAACWADNGRPKVFAYLTWGNPVTEWILHSLEQLAVDALVFCLDLPAALKPRYQSASMTLSTQPFDLEQVANACDLGICHAGHDTSASLLLHGKPLLLAPFQVEQALTARAAYVAGAALIVASADQPKDVQRKIAQLLEEPKFRAAAQTLSNQNKGLSGPPARARVVARCERMLQHAATGAAV